MSESAAQFRADDVKWIIDLVSKNFSGNIDNLKNDLRNDIARLEKGLEKVMSDMVTRKELEEVKEGLESLKKRVEDKETAFGIMTAIKNNWKILAFLAVLAGSVFGSAYWIVDDVHSHYGIANDNKTRQG